MEVEVTVLEKLKNYEKTLAMLSRIAAIGHTFIHFCHILKKG
jgi:pterin-4a-carbinolamine dehydratase